MVLVAHNAGPYRLISESVVAGVVLVLSYFMVSRIKFRSFKDLRLIEADGRSCALLLVGSLGGGEHERRRQGVRCSSS